MDWKSIDIVEFFVTSDVSLEYLPDVASSVSSVLVILWLLRVVVSRRPWLFGFSSAIWTAWLSIQVFARGPVVAEDLWVRASRVYDVAEKLGDTLATLLKALLDLFSPFLNDVTRLATFVWKLVDARQRIYMLIAGVLCFLIIEALGFLRKHTTKIRKATFQAAFLLGAPIIWNISGCLSPEWLAYALAQIITAVPTIGSLWILAEPQPSSNLAPGERQRSSRRDDAAWYATRRQWLSYWCCWPLLAVLETALQRVPKKMTVYGDVRELQYELRQLMVTFVCWLIIWRGCTWLHLALDALLRRTAVVDKLAGFFGATGVSIMRRSAAGSARATLAGASSTWSVLGLMQRFGRKLWMLVAAMVLVGGVVFTLVWLFYSAVSALSRVVTILMWFGAAADSSYTIKMEVEAFYAQKLSFWVLAFIWEALAVLPYVGFVIRLVGPIALFLFFLGGEWILRRALIPLVQHFERLCAGALAAMTSSFSDTCCPRRGGEREEEEIVGFGDDDELGSTDDDKQQEIVEDGKEQDDKEKEADKDSEAHISAEITDESDMEIQDEDNTEMQAATGSAAMGSCRLIQGELVSTRVRQFEGARNPSSMSGTASDPSRNSKEDGSSGAAVPRVASFTGGTGGADDASSVFDENSPDEGVVADQPAHESQKRRSQQRKNNPKS